MTSEGNYLSKTDIAYGYIKKKIVSGEYPPLSDLSEDKLQEDLNVSRTPVREALQRLEKEDFVYVYPRKGTIVTDVTKDLIEDVYEVRELIEPSMVLSSIKQVDRDWLLSMREKFLNAPAGLEAEELRQYYVDLDTELHTKLTDNCPNRYMRRMLRTVQDQNLRLRIKCSDPLREGDHTVDEHVEIIDCILNDDRERLVEVLHFHLEESKKRTLNAFRC